MNFKKIYGLILGVIAAGLTSCSSDLNNEEKAPVGPNETAKRALSISTGDAKTRSEVNIDAGNKWVAGDKFMAFNRTFTGSSSESRYGVLTASSTGTRTTLDGVIACKNGDELGIFYPGSYVTGFDQGKMSVVMTKSYINSDKGQDGSKENLKYFDYSFGKGTVTVNGTSASGSVDMKKLYSILELDFTAGGVKLKNIKKLVLSNVYTEAVYNIPNNELEDYETGAINVNSPVALEKVYVAILPQNHFSPTFEVYTTDNKAYRFTVNAPNFNLVAAKVYPITVAVKEFTPNPPYIEIDGIRWGKYNLQYTPNSKTVGWKDGYHLAKNPWDYFYTESSPMNLEPNVVKFPSSNADNTMFDHFRWGDISKAHSFAYGDKDHYDTSVENIEKKNSNNEYGDIAYYASKGDWRLPNAAEFESLMRNTTQYIGYYPSEAGDVLGVLFVPDGFAHGKIIGKNGQVVANSNVTGNIQGFSGKKYQTSTIVRKFTAEEISKGIFFPAAGTFTNYSSGETNLNNGGRMGYYWTADCFNDKQAKSFTFQFTANGRVMFATVGNSNAGKELPPKNNMYSIRPIYIGQ
ncbi:fimbrillin family protein [Prevotella melaninogenica]|uniref:fimbrillin family protein n=1 Tax=Prevotella melaninogenica TaxID=28132 RepID=UPI0028EF3597|nr:fimbrillin family protein [Prevotella melaninogenica]